MAADRLIEALSTARTRLPGSTWESLVNAVKAEHGVVSREGVTRVLKGIGNAEVRHQLDDAMSDTDGLSWAVVLGVAETAAHWASKEKASLEMVWTGPSSGSFSARRIDQILYDLLAQARNRAFLITFSAYRVARLCDALLVAYNRGVKITLLLETADDSMGQLSNDAVNAFTGLPLHDFEILHWPKAQRELNGSGNPGKLHAKCAVIDDDVVISSANFTDDAFNRNMEMGVLSRDAKLAESIMRHFAELKMSKILSPLSKKG